MYFFTGLCYFKYRHKTYLHYKENFNLSYLVNSNNFAKNHKDLTLVHYNLQVVKI